MKFNFYTKTAWKRLLWYFTIPAFLFFVVMFAFVLSIKWGFWGEMPSDAELKERIAKSFEVLPSIEVYSMDSILLDEYSPRNRSPISYSDLPQHLIDAVIAVEDPDFFDHNGFDFTRHLFSPSQSISEQIVNNFYLHFSENRIVSYLKKVFLVLQLERICSKEDILTLYLNTRYFGMTIVGIQQAVRTYFACNAKNLKVEESAVLVGMLKASTKFNPIRNPHLSLKRRNVILRQMQKYGMLGEKEVDSLKTLPLNTRYGDWESSKFAPHFQRKVKSLVGKWSHENLESMRGLKVYTTLNTCMQEYAEESMRAHLHGLQQKLTEHWGDRNLWDFDENGMNSERVDSTMNRTWAGESIKLYKHIARTQRYQNLVNRGEMNKKGFDKLVPTQILTFEGVVDTLISPLDSLKHHLQLFRAGFVAMESESGKVLAWAGNSMKGLENSDYVASVANQVGSALQPISYATALKSIHPCESVENLPNNYPTWGSSGKTKGFYSGKRSPFFKSNFIYPSNIRLDWEKILDKGEMAVLAKEMGINEIIPTNRSYIGLRTLKMPLYELTGAYNTFNNKGRFVAPQLISHIEDKNGNLLQKFNPSPAQVLEEEVSDQMLVLLEECVQKGISGRLSWKYKFKERMAGRPSTTNSHESAWFFGMTPQLTAGIWVGGLESEVRFRATNLGRGGYMALPIFGEFAKRLKEDAVLKDYLQGNFGISDAVYQDLKCEN